MSGMVTAYMKCLYVVKAEPEQIQVLPEGALQKRHVRTDEVLPDATP